MGRGALGRVVTKGDANQVPKRSAFLCFVCAFFFFCLCVFVFAAYLVTLKPSARTHPEHSPNAVDFSALEHNFFQPAAPYHTEAWARHQDMVTLM